MSHTKHFSSPVVMYKDGDRCNSVGMYAHICLPTGSTSLHCFTAQTRDFVLLQTAQTGSGAQTTFNPFGAGCTLPGAKGADPWSGVFISMLEVLHSFLNASDIFTTGKGLLKLWNSVFRVRWLVKIRPLLEISCSLVPVILVLTSPSRVPHL